MTSTSNSYHSSSIQTSADYEVFLSFRGPDTRTGFTDHLYEALQRADVSTFRDSEEIPIGAEIPQELQKAIDQSKIFIPIFSKNYASSKWCLTEFTQMMKRKKSTGQLIFPIFYDVTPSDVQHQKGSFEEAFRQHEIKVEKEIVREWKEALSEVATLKGWEKDKIANGHEAELVKEVVSRVCTPLGKDKPEGRDNMESVPPPPSVKFMFNPDFIEFESTKSTCHQIIEALKDDSCDIVGVVGMGGVGKTTLVKEIAKKADQLNFDQVVMVVVSQNAEVRRIQGQIASMLRLSFHQEADELGRASQLRERIMNVRSLLVILDDVWACLDLTAVGIPVGVEHKGCRIMLTTRKEDVCTVMRVRTDKKIRVKLLSNEESWDLFKKNAGNGIKSVCLKKVAESVMRECQGLPIALVTVGRALRDKNFDEWTAAKLQLENSTATLIEGVDEAVVSCLKLSYNYLKGDETKLCFLLCCLFPEDYDIGIEDIARYVVGKGSLFQYVDTIAKVRSLVCSTIEKLKASCLLLESEHREKNRVKMHDVVRDVAISIASEGENHFWVRTGAGLMDWPTMSSIEQYTGISLMSNNMRVLREGLECPKLEFLSLCENNELDKIPNSFFKGMKMLKVLDLRKSFGCGVSFRPKLEILSFQCLTSLHTLLLDNCPLDDISVLGTLKELETLSLSNTTIKALPLEVGELTSLRLLDLSGCVFLEMVTANVISRLSRLEELYMGYSSFDNWEVESTCEERRNASLLELQWLPRLGILSVQVRDTCQFPTNFTLPNVVKYFIGVGRLPVWSNIYPNSRDLRVEREFNLDGLKTILHLAENLTLDSLHLENTLTNSDRVEEEIVLTDFGLNSLKFFEIWKLDCIAFLTSTTAKVVFSNLQELRLHNMKGMVKLGTGVQLPHGSLQNLRVLEICGCNLQGPAVPSIWVHRLYKLKKVKIYFCEHVTEIFEIMEIAGESKNTPPQLLSNLRELELEGLSQLLSICNGKLVSIFCNLTVVRIIECDKLVLIFSPRNNLPLRLLHLQKLIIKNCKNLKVILEEIEEVSGESEDMIQFPNLRTVKVSECEQLETLFTVSMARGLPKLEKLKVSKNKKLEEIVSRNENRVGEQGDNAEVIVWPQLTYMVLDELPSLWRFCPTSDSIHLPLLKVLEFRRCLQMWNFASDTAAYGLRIPESVISALISGGLPLIRRQHGMQRIDQEPTLQEIINIKLIESGEKERLMELLRERLIECGWQDEMKSLCREFTRKKGRDNVTVDALVHVITPKGRASVPDSVKAELLQRIRSFLSSAAL